MKIAIRVEYGEFYFIEIDEDRIKKFCRTLGRLVDLPETEVKKMVEITGGYQRLQDHLRSLWKQNKKNRVVKEERV